MELPEQAITDFDRNFGAEIADIPPAGDLDKENQDSNPDVNHDEFAEQSRVLVPKSIIDKQHLKEWRDEFERHTAHAEEASPNEASSVGFGVPKKTQEGLAAMDARFGEMTADEAGRPGDETSNGHKRENYSGLGLLSGLLYCEDYRETEAERPG